VRLDGKPVFDTLSAAFGMGQIFNPITFDETGFTTGSSYIITGLNPDGSTAADANCSDWTGTGKVVQIGRSDGGPGVWASGMTLDCSYKGSLYCLGKTRTTTVKPTAAMGRRIWVSPGFAVNGGMNPDAFCQASRPSDVTTALALVATNSRSAASVLTPTANYVRPDGTLVGTGAQIASTAAIEIQSGIWQFADGTYVRDPMASVWTGAQSVDAVGINGYDCTDWSSTASSGVVGNPREILPFWNSGRRNCGDTSVSVYCLQTAP